MTAGPQIRTVSGELIDLLDPRPEQIHLDDIAHALGRAPRYAGHTPRHYSVAEHSIHVRRVVWAAVTRCDDLAPAARIRLARLALLHDAAEAYTGDLPAPIKRWINALSGGAWTRLEHALDSAIRTRFGLDDPSPAERDVVHDADQRVYASECGALGRPDAAAGAPILLAYWPDSLASARWLEECGILRIT